MAWKKKVIKTEQTIVENVKEVTKFPLVFENHQNRDLLFGIKQKFCWWKTVINTQDELEYLERTEDYKNWFISLIN